MRADQVVPPGSWTEEEERGTVYLDFHERYRRRIVLPTESGEDLLIDLPEATHLKGGDGLLLDGGGVIRVIAAEEHLLEITAPDPVTLVRIAWHLGNRHLPAELHDGRLRIRDDHVIADLVTHLGGTATPLHASFDPEQGAYAGGHDHSHSHD